VGYTWKCTKIEKDRHPFEKEMKEKGHRIRKD
jgi:hypothetical protein